jgi:hypothetical protein
MTLEGIWKALIISRLAALGTSFLSHAPSSNFEGEPGWRLERKEVWGIMKEKLFTVFVLSMAVGLTIMLGRCSPVPASSEAMSATPEKVVRYFS